MRLGAIKARFDAQRARIDLLQAAGVLPAELPQLGVLRDIDWMADVIMHVFDRYDVAIEAQREIRDLLDRRGRAPEAG